MSVLCEHLREAKQGASPLVEHLQLDYYDGLTAGVVRCKSCRTYYYARGIAFWGGPTHGSRVFALYPMPISTYDECEAVREHWDNLHATGQLRHNRATSSLRKRLGALASRRRAPVRVLCWDLHRDTLLAIAPMPAELRLPGADAIARSDAETDLPWFQHLGLAGHAT